jgi:hypothetical protein
MKAETLRLTIFVDKESDPGNMIFGATDTVAEDLYNFERSKHLRIQFPVRMIEFAREVAERLSAALGTELTDHARSVTADRFETEGNPLSTSIAAHFRLLEALYDRMDATAGTSTDTNFGEIADHISLADDDAGHELLSDWVFGHAVELALMKKSFAGTHVAADIAALELVGTLYSPANQSREEVVARRTRLDHYQFLQSELLRRKKPSTEAKLSVIHIEKLNAQLCRTDRSLTSGFRLY